MELWTKWSLDNVLNLALYHFVQNNDYLYMVKVNLIFGGIYTFLSKIIHSFKYLLIISLTFTIIFWLFYYECVPCININVYIHYCVAVGPLAHAPLITQKLIKLQYCDSDWSDESINNSMQYYNKMKFSFDNGFVADSFSHCKKFLLIFNHHVLLLNFPSNNLNVKIMLRLVSPNRQVWYCSKIYDD